MVLDTNNYKGFVVFGKANSRMTEWIDTDAGPSTSNAAYFYNPAAYWCLF